MKIWILLVWGEAWEKIHLKKKKNLPVILRLGLVWELLQ